MSVTDGIQYCGPVDPRDSIKGLAHAFSYLVLHIATIDMNEEGESQWLNSLLVDLSSQNEEIVPEAGKRFVMAMVASIEFSLRKLAESEKRRRNQDAER